MRAKVIKANPYNIRVGTILSVRQKDGDASPFPFTTTEGQCYQFKEDELEMVETKQEQEQESFQAHPFDDLTEDEFRQMVDFCRDYFRHCPSDTCACWRLDDTTDDILYWMCDCSHHVTSDSSKCDSCGRWKAKQKGRRFGRWRWKKGDWGMMRYPYGIGIVVGGTKLDPLFRHFNPDHTQHPDGEKDNEAIPLPLPHQWMESLWEIDDYYCLLSDGVYLKGFDTYEGKDRMVLTWIDDSPYQAFRKVIGGDVQV